MARYSYAIAVGSDQTVLTNIEDMIAYAPVGKPIPLGSVRRTTLNQHVQSNGAKVITWSITALDWADFETLILFIFGDWETENAAVTIDTRGSDELFHRGNANAVRPVEGEDYKRRENGKVEDLVITLRDFQEFGSGFTTGFSFGFEA